MEVANKLSLLCIPVVMKLSIFLFHPFFQQIERSLKISLFILIDNSRAKISQFIILSAFHKIFCSNATLLSKPIHFQSIQCRNHVILHPKNLNFIPKKIYNWSLFKRQLINFLVIAQFSFIFKLEQNILVNFVVLKRFFKRILFLLDYVWQGVLR